ncbi:hypothetical protein MKW92_028278 [Papaver armeniacum]|nr:hypothetical protein MKW92_028278 [Papaver armeniacum]
MELFLQFCHITRDLLCSIQLTIFSFLGSEELRKWRDLCAFRLFPWKCETGLKIFKLDDGYIPPVNESLSNQT